jgi:glycosyltransferase involved in cell wall biosynthesis
MPSGVRDVIVPSQSAAEVLAPFLASAARLHIVANPVPAHRYSPANVTGNQAFVFNGRLQHDKGPALFAAAAHRAHVPAVFIGAGDELDAVRRANPEAEVTGWLDADSVHARLRSARALVSPALWYEVQGLAPLEAASHGVPAVVSDLSFLRDLVDDEQTGLWFRGGDADDLATKLRLLADDDALAGRLGRAAYERFWAGPWDLETHLDGLEAVYTTALTP